MGTAGDLRISSRPRWLPSPSRLQSEHRSSADAPPITNGFDLRLYRPAVDSKGQFSVNGTDILGHLSIAFGLVGDYGLNLLRIGAGGANGQNTRPLIENMFNASLIANIGLFNWVVIGVQLPVHIVDGPGVNTPGGSFDVSGYADSSLRLAYQGLGDLGVNVKLRLLRADRGPHIGLAVILQAGFPPGNESQFFAGEPGVSLWPMLAAEWRPVTRLHIDLNLRLPSSFLRQGRHAGAGSGGTQVTVHAAVDRRSGCVRCASHPRHC